MRPAQVPGKFQLATNTAFTRCWFRPSFKHRQVKLRADLQLIKQLCSINTCPGWIATGKAVVPCEPDLFHTAAALKGSMLSTIRLIPCPHARARWNGPV